jgi:hypothetical protein
MPRYFFDVHDGTRMQRDDDGTECGTVEDARTHAKQVLPAIALHELPPDGDRMAYTVLVRDEENNLIYSGTLSFAGLMLGP